MDRTKAPPTSFRLTKRGLSELRFLARRRGVARPAILETLIRDAAEAERAKMRSLAADDAHWPAG